MNDSISHVVIIR